jgi:hypothetical protein
MGQNGPEFYDDEVVFATYERRKRIPLMMFFSAYRPSMS